MSDLDGLGFSFRVPVGWSCTPLSQAKGATWACGPDGQPDVGGVVTVRPCSIPCDGPKKVRMRKAENAFGLPWVRADAHSAYAESAALASPSGPRYALAAVRYWHSRPGGPLDRQVVVQMTAPPDRKAELQKVMNDIRTATP
jgi:hypothetical protein